MRRGVTKPGLAIVCLIILALGLPLGFAAEDVPETAYDESEALPYEGAPLFSIVLRPVAARTTQEGLSFFHPKTALTFLSAAAVVCDTDANRSAAARTSLALICTLRC